MKELLLIPIFSMSLYLVYVYLRYGMTISISATYKVIRGWEKPWFSLTLWSVALPIMIVGIEGIPDNKVQVLFFLAGALICLIAASPAYWTNRMELTAHLIGSYGGISLGMIACLIHYPSPATFLLVGVFIFFAGTQALKDLKLNNSIYWVEVAAIITAVAVLALN